LLRKGFLHALRLVEMTKTCVIPSEVCLVIPSEVEESCAKCLQGVGTMRNLI